MRYKNIYDAANAWVSTMVSVPLSVVSKLQLCDWEDIAEVTPPVRGDRVHLYGALNGEGEVQRFVSKTGKYIILLDDLRLAAADEDDFEVLRDETLPMWGTMWAFSDPCDEHWLENNIRTMADCGFRVYESEDYGWLFGIDGAGYDFYTAHWIPLYKARGLQWHEEALYG